MAFRDRALAALLRSSAASGGSDLMARSASIAVATQTELLIIKTLHRIVPAAATSYEQAIIDLADVRRRSYRGIAHELREVLRETLNYLAPDAEVMAVRGFEFEEGQV